MNAQFSLGRLFQLVVVVAVISALFAHLKWPLAMLILSGLNGLASVWCWFTKRPRLTEMAAVTALLFIATLFFTDWGLSSPHPVVRVAWWYLIAACVTEFLVIAMWLVSVPPTTSKGYASTNSMSDSHDRPAEMPSGALYCALAKWERHAAGHSLGYLRLSQDRLWFVPHARSILVRGFDISLTTISGVEQSDNWLWRGAVNIRLTEPLELNVEFRVDFDEPVPGIELTPCMEKRIFHSDVLRLFLGFSRKTFLRAVQHAGLATKSSEC